VHSIFTAPGATFPFGTHVAVAEVDTETGRAVLRRVITVDDAGLVLNPLLAEGQRHGGIAQGAAQALLEEFVYDAEGNPLTASFADYPIVSATELPSFELASMETPTSYNPLGAKGIGEAEPSARPPGAGAIATRSTSRRQARGILEAVRIWRAISQLNPSQPNPRSIESA
jgi:carbon-monoxide dehydrogenase large subunit